MISSNIKNQRIKKGLTQKDLAAQLHVTAQAISRWEKGDVEPSLDTIKDMSKIFGISIDELLNGESPKIENEKLEDVVKQVAEETAKQVKIPEQKQVLAICDRCKQPIYDSDKIISKIGHHGRTAYNYYICSDCEDKEQKQEKENAIKYGISQRKKSFWWSGFFAILVVIFGIIYVTATTENKSIGIALTVILPILTYTFSSCMFLKNNFIEDVFLEIASWGFVKFPGLIFSFDLDGFSWLIGMKILFWIIGFILGFSAITLALVICMSLSIIVYPIALKKNITHPELSEDL
jgi:transcriptional regulator with XRE-family HTH domain